MSGFFHEFEVKEKHMNAPWSGSKKNFRCALCGHKFKVGDRARVQFTNNIKEAPGNPLVCQLCDDGDVIDKWKKMHEEYKEIRKRYWWFFRFIGDL